MNHGANIGGFQEKMEACESKCNVKRKFNSISQFPRGQGRSNFYANYDPGMTLDKALRMGWTGARLESLQQPGPPARASLINPTRLWRGAAYWQHQPETATNMLGTDN